MNATLPYLDPSLTVDERLEDLLHRMTLREKIGQMVQYTAEPEGKNGDASNSGLDDLVAQPEPGGDDAYAQGVRNKAELVQKGEIGSFLKVPGIAAANYLQKVAETSRLKVPLLIATDAIHGHGDYPLPATIFPTALCLASSFDPHLAEQMADMTRAEMRATGYHWTFSPNVEVVRDQRWGRSGETFGEDPYLIGEMGRAMVRGYQTRTLGPTSVLACAKHMLGGGEAFNGINAAETDISERTIRGVHLPPFEACAEEGCYTFMAAHNSLNGIPCHAHKGLLTDVLRKKWRTKGFVVSDWVDVERLYSLFHVCDSFKAACGLAVDAGIDVHMHGPGFLDNMESLVKEGYLSENRIDAAVRSILRAKFLLGLFENRTADPEAAAKVVLCRQHKDAALKIAQHSIVLLKNENDILPLSPGMKSIFVCGPSADAHYQLGDWSKPQPSENVVTVLQGIRNAVSPGTKIDYLPCSDNDGGNAVFTMPASFLHAATARAAASDCAIVVVGENALRHVNPKTAGENCDYTTLELPGNQTELIQSVHKAGKPVVVVLINTRALAVTWCAEHVAALIEAWEPGLMGGQAVADILFGNVNPSGKLPISFPRSSGHLKCYYNSTPLRFRRYGNSTAEPLFPFGYGLSYTTFAYSNLTCPHEAKIGERIMISVDVTNTGNRDGDEIVLLYAKDLQASVVMPLKELKAFLRVSLRSGETKTVALMLGPQSLSLVNAELERIVEPGDFEIRIGNLIQHLMVVDD